MQRFSPLLFSLLFLSPVQAKPAAPLETILPRFEKLAAELFAESGVPGMSIAIVSGGKPIYLKGFGVPKTGDQRQVSPDTVFQLASCSKPMTSTALAVLVGQGKIRWDDRITKVLPEFSVSDPWVTDHLTYRDMLCHHSGLPGFAGDVLEDLGYDRATILGRLRHLPQAYDFRVGYAYTNFGFTVAGEAAARVEETSYETMMDEVLFKPAGMTSTSARFSDFQNAPDHASSHRLVDGKATPTQRMPQAQAPAGGISSSARDMARYMQLHLQKGSLDGQSLVPEEALAQTYRVHSLSSNNPATFSGGGFYGLGWGVSYDQKGRLRLSHSGAFSLGVRSIVTMIPQEEVGIAVLSNAFPSGIPEALSMSFFNLYDGQEVTLAEAREIDKKVVTVMSGMADSGYQRPKPTRLSPALPLASYAGTFDNEFFGPATLWVEGKRLLLKLGTKTLPLEHLDRDVFLALPPSKEFEDLDPFELRFTIDGSGQVTGFRQEGLGDGPPWFSRLQR